MASRDLTAGVPGYWGLAEVAPFERFSTENGVFRDTEIQTTISVTRKVFMIHVYKNIVSEIIFLKLYMSL